MLAIRLYGRYDFKEAAMIPPEHLGLIITRMALADDAVLAALLQFAHNGREGRKGQGGGGLLPGDYEALQRWSAFVRILRESLNA